MSLTFKAKNFFEDFVNRYIHLNCKNTLGALVISNSQIYNDIKRYIDNETKIDTMIQMFQEVEALLEDISFLLLDQLH